MAFVDVSTVPSGGGGGGGGTPYDPTIPLTDLTTNYTVVTADNGKWFSNRTASGLIILTLPASPAKGFVIGANSVAPQSSSTMAFQASGGNVIQTITAVTSANGRMGCTGSGRPRGCVLQVAYVGGGLWSWIGGYPYDWNTQ